MKIETKDTLNQVIHLLDELTPVDESSLKELNHLRDEVRTLIAIAGQGFEWIAEQNLEELKPRIDELVRKIVS